MRNCLRALPHFAEYDPICIRFRDSTRSEELITADGAIIGFYFLRNSFQRRRQKYKGPFRSAYYLARESLHESRRFAHEASTKKIEKIKSDNCQSQSHRTCIPTSTLKWRDFSVSFFPSLPIKSPTWNNLIQQPTCTHNPVALITFLEQLSPTFLFRRTGERGRISGQITVDSMPGRLAEEIASKVKKSRDNISECTFELSLRKERVSQDI